MSLKNLFKNQGQKFLKPTTKSQVGLDIESTDLIDAYVKDKETFIPTVDFEEPENFARYGSAEKYYTDAFTRITDQYPYDGSAKDKMRWYVSSSYIDKHIYDSQYPKTNGYINFCPKGYGSFSAGSTTDWVNPALVTKIYRAPEIKEYILIKGGPHADSNLDIKTPSSLANIYDTDKNKVSNLRINPPSGSTVEFWLKVDGYPDIGAAGGTDRMALFDIWNGVTASNASYGRFELYIDNDGNGDNPAFGLHVISGSTGADTGDVDPDVLGFNSISASVSNEGLFTSYSKNTLADSSWHHYAFVVKNDNSDLTAKMYVDGQIQQTLTKTGHALKEISGGPLVATLGASNTWPEYIKNPGSFASAASYSTARGANKFSGSMDEFRYWKDARTSKEIGRYWFTQVNGGTNKDDANVDLGVYYKFNEGITSTASVDATILDYSGRISNGSWIIDSGMTGSQYRSTDSAIVLASAATKESKDPIIYGSHSAVKSKREELELTGKTHDYTNPASLYNSLPAWIQEEDESGEEIKDLMQIMSSYFDTLQLQIESLPTLKDVQYQTGSHKPHFFNGKLLQNMGFDTSDLFYDEDFLENFDDRDDDRLFREKLHNVKNTIYNNIYNNLVHINKTKGTEKSFRNLLRCFGIDEELIKLNLYSNNATYTLDDSYRETSKIKKLLNFNSGSTSAGTRKSSVYQYTDPLNSNSISYVSGSEEDATNLTLTTEAEVYFPIKPSEKSKHFEPYTEASSSLFGCYTAEQDPTDYSTQARDIAGFQVYAVRKKEEDPGSYFQLTGSYIPNLESEFFEDIYDNEKWNFSVRFRHEKASFIDEITGSFASGSTNNIIAEFHGINTEAGFIKRQFAVSGTLDTDLHAHWKTFFERNRRFYIGAHHENAAGSLLTPTDVKFSYLRHWLTNITDEEIKAHSLSLENYGVTHPFRNDTIFDRKRSVENVFEVPKIETLALNWNFSNLTGSDDSGEFIVTDESSGSADHLNRQGWLSSITKKDHPGIGHNFASNRTDIVNNTYISTLKQTIPENLQSSELVKVLDFDDELFTRETRPINYMFALEKNPYQNISEEILNFFATIKDFNNLIGEPVNRYRQSYKDIEKIRNLFFEKIGNTPSVEKYINFYKWIDSSISDMLMNLVPASANFTDGVRTVIESHVLERNKYWTKFPTMEYKPGADPEASIKGVKELKYNWKFGHAPITQNEQDNCLWWKDRAPRDVQAFDGGATDKDFLSSSNASDSEFFNLNKKDILQAAITETTSSNPKLATVSGITYQGSSYALRKLSKTHELNVNPVSVNATSLKNKKYGLWKNELMFGSAKMITINSSSLTSDPAAGCADELTPKELKKHKYNFKINISEDNEYLHGHGELLAPFSIYSSSVSSGYNSKLSQFSNDVQITNLHIDSYFGEEPMQGPFTEKYVGGHQYRHANLNNSNGKELDIRSKGTNPRPEGYHLEILTYALRLRHASVDPNSSGIDKDQPTAKYFRDETAKRPVNIRNIRQGTGSIAGGVTVIGNFEKNYQVVHTTGRSVNDLWFRSGSHGAGGIDDSFKPSEYVSGAVDNRLPDRSVLSDGSKNRTVITERFSAPGSPETLGRGFLDDSESFSVYNNINYRNSLVRNFLNEYSAKKTEQFGLLSNTTVRSESYEGQASFHKVHRNTHYRMELEDGRELTDDQNSGFDSSLVYKTASVSDNQFVQRVIPQSERQYAWITASLDNRADPSKSAPYGFVITQDGMMYSSADAIQGWYNPFTWVTASEVGSAVIPDFNKRYFGAIRASNSASMFPDLSGPGAAGRAAQDSSLVTTDFAGLNTNIYEPITESNNTLGYESLTSLDGGGSSEIHLVNYINQGPPNDDDNTGQPFGVSSVLNSLLLNRNGPGGWPSWKQIRLNRHPVVRDMRKNNRISILDPDRGKMFDATGGTQERQLISFTEPVVGFNAKPLLYHFGQAGPNIRVAFESKKETFANDYGAGSLSNKLIGSPGHTQETIKTGYEVLLDLYKGRQDNQLNFVTMTYSQTVFPRARNTGLGKIRTRQNYAETGGSATEGTGLDHPDRNTFWTPGRDLHVLTRNQAENSLGNEDNGQGRNDLSGTHLSVWAMAPIEPGPLDGEHERYNFFGEMYPSGTYESLYTTASISFMRSVASRATGSDNDFPALGEATSRGVYGSLTAGLSISSLVGKGGVPVRMGKYDAHLNRKIRDVRFAGARAPTYNIRPRNPWYNSYDEYAQDIKLIGQGYSIIPEFKISEHIDYYVGSGGDFQQTNNKILSLKGASVTSSAPTPAPFIDAMGNETSDTEISDTFFTTYSNSDFMKQFSVIKKDHLSTSFRTSRVTMKCSGVKKLLPYNGFYPMQRTVQLAALLSQSLGPDLAPLGGSSHTASWNNATSRTTLYPITDFKQQRLNALLQPIASPGILFNSIKAGIAVDYPIHTGNVGVQVDASTRHVTGHALEVISSRPNYRLPFEALVNFKNFVPSMKYPGSPSHKENQNSKINFVEPNFIHSTQLFGDNAAPGSWHSTPKREDIGPQVYAQWTGEIEPQFEMAMNNFLGETVRFFLKDQNVKSFSSGPEKLFKQMSPGNTYYMDIVLRKTDNFVLSEGIIDDIDVLDSIHTGSNSSDYTILKGYQDSSNLVDQRGYIYGPGYTHYSKALDAGSTGSYTSTDTVAYGSAYAPHSPPYLYGESIARVAFTPDATDEVTRVFTLREIIDGSTIEYFNLHRGLDKNNPEDRDIEAAPAMADQMSVASSVILDATVRDPTVEFDPSGNPVVISEEIGSTDNDRWVIYPKWECPTLNVTSSDTSVVRSIWHNYGRLPESNEGIFMEVRESFPEITNNPAGLLVSTTRSLLDVMGFVKAGNADTQRIGELAEEKEISEAIVAIPYFSHPVDDATSGVKTVNVFSNYNFVTIDEDVFALTRKNFEDSGGEVAMKAGDDPLNFASSALFKDIGNLIPKQDIKKTSISDMIQKMQKYVMPPKFNFLRKVKSFDKPKPFVMYMFEFNHVLGKQDLCDIWNNIMPDIALRAQKQESVISHDISPYEFFGSSPETADDLTAAGLASQMSPFTLGGRDKVSTKMRWMIFKVKKKAETKYSNITLSAEDDSDFKFDFGGQAGVKEPDYTYNWPYDFFSLVELAKIDASIEIKDRETDD
tara:strand:+ start:40081 stop:49482 length:9402 start_codon:yes stop_codon:yes gene_type:complete